MAIKNTKSVGKLIGGQSEQYWLNAAKQIEWPVDIGEKHISIPVNEVDKAQENLMVQHFINAGFFIQTCIPNGKTEVFDPDIRLKLPLVKIVLDNAKFKIGDRFKVKSTECELEITYMESKKIHLKYTNRTKHDLISSEDMIVKNLNWGNWEGI